MAILTSRGWWIMTVVVVEGGGRCQWFFQPHETETRSVTHLRAMGIYATEPQLPWSASSWRRLQYLYTSRIDILSSPLMNKVVMVWLGIGIRCVGEGNEKRQCHGWLYDSSQDRWQVWIWQDRGKLLYLQHRFSPSILLSFLYSCLASIPCIYYWRSTINHRITLTLVCSLCFLSSLPLGQDGC